MAEVVDCVSDVSSCEAARVDGPEGSMEERARRRHSWIGGGGRRPPSLYTLVVDLRVSQGQTAASQGFLYSRPGGGWGRGQHHVRLSFLLNQRTNPVDNVWQSTAHDMVVCKWLFFSRTKSSSPMVRGKMC